MNKKAFTLLELLAVIVVLAIIALVVTPFVTKAIKEARKGAFKNSAYGIVEAAELYYASNMLKENEITTKTFNTLDGKLMTTSGEELTFKGEKPKGGSSVVINEDGKIKLNITNGTYFASKEFDETEILISDRADEAPTRDELAKEMNDLKKELNALKTTSNNQNAKLNNVETKVANLETNTNESNMFLNSYPVGSIYISVNNTNPGEIYGGTWEAYGTGRTLVGVDATQAEFNAVNKIGGEKTHTLTIAEMPSHNHSIALRENNSGTATFKSFSSNYAVNTSDWYNPTSGTYILNSGGSSAHNNLQPYITVYMWKRTK